MFDHVLACISLNIRMMTSKHIMKSLENCPVYLWDKTEKQDVFVLFCKQFWPGKIPASVLKMYRLSDYTQRHIHLAHG